ncbi:hypothetical protein PCURB6_39050 [Paenibacillus curdlanolyticus]|nr:hypothetical protein PCURB6_39050 [Paenibacillus curdlanolyticus]
MGICSFYIGKDMWPVLTLPIGRSRILIRMPSVSGLLLRTGFLLSG